MARVIGQSRSEWQGRTSDRIQQTGQDLTQGYLAGSDLKLRRQRLDLENRMFEVDSGLRTLSAALETGRPLPEVMTLMGDLFEGTFTAMGVDPDQAKDMLTALQGTEFSFQEMIEMVNRNLVPPDDPMRQHIEEEFGGGQPDTPQDTDVPASFTPDTPMEPEPEAPLTEQRPQMASPGLGFEQVQGRPDISPMEYREVESRTANIVDGILQRWDANDNTNIADIPRIIDEELGEYGQAHPDLRDQIEREVLQAFNLRGTGPDGNPTGHDNLRTENVTQARQRVQEIQSFQEQNPRERGSLQDNYRQPPGAEESTYVPAGTRQLVEQFRNSGIDERNFNLSDPQQRELFEEFMPSPDRLSVDDMRERLGATHGGVGVIGADRLSNQAVEARYNAVRGFTEWIGENPDQVPEQYRDHPLSYQPTEEEIYLRVAEGDWPFMEDYHTGEYYEAVIETIERTGPMMDQVAGVGNLARGLGVAADRANDIEEQFGGEFRDSMNQLIRGRDSWREENIVVSSDGQEDILTTADGDIVTEEQADELYRQDVAEAAENIIETQGMFYNMASYTDMVEQDGGRQAIGQRGRELWSDPAFLRAAGALYGSAGLIQTSQAIEEREFEAEMMEDPWYRYMQEMEMEISLQTARTNYLTAETRLTEAHVNADRAVLQRVLEASLPQPLQDLHSAWMATMIDPDVPEAFRTQARDDLTTSLNTIMDRLDADIRFQPRDIQQGAWFWRQDYRGVGAEDVRGFQGGPPGAGGPSTGDPQLDGMLQDWSGVNQ